VTTWQESKALWIGGGLVGGLIGYFLLPQGKWKTTAGRTAAGAVLGAILTGGIGDGVLEQQQRCGKFSLLPLGKNC
jgi:hypothetical protein